MRHACPRYSSKQVRRASGRLGHHKSSISTQKRRSFQKKVNYLFLSVNRKKTIMYHCFIYIIISTDPESTTALILSALILPGHLIFFFTIFFIDQIDLHVDLKPKLTASLVLLYLLFVFIQVGSFFSDDNIWIIFNCAPKKSKNFNLKLIKIPPK